MIRDYIARIDCDYDNENDVESDNGNGSGRVTLELRPGAIQMKLFDSGDSINS